LRRLYSLLYVYQSISITFLVNTCYKHFLFFFFFFNDTATTEIYTLSLHDALPILLTGEWDALLRRGGFVWYGGFLGGVAAVLGLDRKSTRLNSSHRTISYAVFCLKKKKKKQASV